MFLLHFCTIYFHYVLVSFGITLNYKKNFEIKESVLQDAMIKKREIVNLLKTSMLEGRLPFTV